MTNRIDAHQHFWRVERGDYHWMPSTGPLHHDWLPNDLAPLNQAAGITATVAVQAAQTVAETEFLLDLAADPAHRIAAVVGWVDLDSPTAIAEIERLAANPKLAAARPMLQDLHDPAWILRPRVVAAIARLADLGLAYEVLSYPGHLPYVQEALTSAPDDLRVVIDHLSKPQYSDPPPPFWQTWIEQLAKRERTAIKISGMVTEVGPTWSAASVRAATDTVLAAFGPDRVMFGTDWPVCLQVARHDEVVGLAESCAAELTPDEQARFWHDTAWDYYELGLRTGI